MNIAIVILREKKNQVSCNADDLFLLVATIAKLEVCSAAHVDTIRETAYLFYALFGH